MDVFFGECLENDEKLNELKHGEASCFDNEIITRDEVFAKLVQPWPHD